MSMQALLLCEVLDAFKNDGRTICRRVLVAHQDCLVEVLQDATLLGIVDKVIDGQVGVAGRLACIEEKDGIESVVVLLQGLLDCGELATVRSLKLGVVQILIETFQEVLLCILFEVRNQYTCLDHCI